MATKVGTIYCEVRGDDTQWKKDMSELRSAATQSGRDVSEALNSAISPQKASAGIKTISTGLTQLAQTAKVPENQFKQTADAIADSFGDVADSIDMTRKEFAELNERMLRNKAFQTATNDLRNLTRAADLTVDETKKLAKQMGYSAKQAQEMADKIHRVDRRATDFTGVMTKLGSVIGAVAGTAGMAYMVKQSLDLTTEMQKNATMAGLTIEAYQELSYAADQYQITQDALTDGMKELNLRAEEFVTAGAGPGKEAFERLGYTQAELNSKLKDTPALLSEIIDKMQGMEKAAQMRIADEIFGGQGGEQFVAMIQGGSEAIEGFTEKAHEMGLVMSNEAAESAEKANKAIDTLTKQLQTQFNSVIAELGPDIEGLADDMGKWVSANREFISQDLPQYIGNIGTAIENVVSSNGFGKFLKFFTYGGLFTSGSVGLHGFLKQLGVFDGDLQSEIEGLEAEYDFLGRQLEDLQGTVADPEVEAAIKSRRSEIENEIQSLKVQAEALGNSVGSTRDLAAAINELNNSLYDTDWGRWTDGLDELTTEQKNAINSLRDLAVGSSLDDFFGDIDSFSFESMADEWRRAHEDAYAVRLELAQYEYTEGMADAEMIAAETRAEIWRQNHEEMYALRKQLSEYSADEIADIEREAAEKGANAGEDAWKHMLENIQDEFADTFRDIYDGQIDDFDDFTDRMLDTFKSMAAEMTAQGLINLVFSSDGTVTDGTDGGGTGEGSTSLLGSFGSGLTSFSNVGDLFSSYSWDSATDIAGSLGTVVGVIGAAYSLYSIVSSFLEDEPEPYIGIQGGGENAYRDFATNSDDWDFNVWTQDVGSPEYEQEFIDYFEDRFETIDEQLSFSLLDVINSTTFRVGDDVDANGWIDLSSWENDMEGLVEYMDQEIFSDLRDGLLKAVGFEGSGVWQVRDYFDDDFFESITEEGESIWDAFIGFADTVESVGVTEFADEIARQMDDYGESVEQAYENLVTLTEASDTIGDTWDAIAQTELTSTLEDLEETWESLNDTLSDANVTAEQLTETTETMNAVYGANLTTLSATTLQSALVDGTDIEDTIQSGMISALAAEAADSIMEGYLNQLNEDIGAAYLEGGLESALAVLADFDFSGVQAEIEDLQTTLTETFPDALDDAFSTILQGYVDFNTALDSSYLASGDVVLELAGLDSENFSTISAAIDTLNQAVQGEENGVVEYASSLVAYGAAFESLNDSLAAGEISSTEYSSILTTISSLYTESIEDIEGTKDSLEDLIDEIGDIISDLSTEGLSGDTLTTAAQDEWNEVVASVMSGDTDAYDDLGSAASNYLDALESSSSTSYEYQRARGSIIRTLEDLEEAAEDEVSDIEALTEVAEEQVVELTDISTATTDSLAELYSVNDTVSDLSETFSETDFASDANLTDLFSTFEDGGDINTLLSGLQTAMTTVNDSINALELTVTTESTISTTVINYPDDLVDDTDQTDPVSIDDYASVYDQANELIGYNDNTWWGDEWDLSSSGATDDWLDWLGDATADELSDFAGTIGADSIAEAVANVIEAVDMVNDIPSFSGGGMVSGPASGFVSAVEFHGTEWILDEPGIRAIAASGGGSSGDVKTMVLAFQKLGDRIMKKIQRIETDVAGIASGKKTVATS